MYLILIQFKFILLNLSIYSKVIKHFFKYQITIKKPYFEQKSILSLLLIRKEYLSFPPSKTLLNSFNLSCSSFMKLESLLAEVNLVFFIGFSLGFTRILMIKFRLIKAFVGLFDGIAYLRDMVNFL